MARTKKTQSKRGTKHAETPLPEGEIQRAAARAGLAPSRFEALAEGGKALVSDPRALRLVVDCFLDWDGGPNVGASALQKIERELRALGHYLTTTEEPSEAIQLSAPWLMNLADFAEGASALANAESGGAS